MSLAPGEVAVSSIMVAVRKRPKLPKTESDENDIVHCDSSTTVVVYESKTKVDLTPAIEPAIFNFDYVFDETATNADVYEKCCCPLLQEVRGGGGAVVFAFGQAGSGKTYTMLGHAGVCQGIVGFIVRDLLAEDASCTLSVSFYELYGVKLFDLLNGHAEVKMLQDEFGNLHIVGLSEREIADKDELDRLMSEGQLLRASGTTHANHRSSRSHAVLEIKLRPREHEGTAPCGRMTLVDLAGSERAADTADTHINVRREGAEINKSLLALKECLRAISMRRKHLPFRASKLTQILREGFIGQSKTCVIANISPCQRHCEDTLNTLRYAYRIKELKVPTSDELEHKTPRPCHYCGLPILAGEKHACLRLNVRCPHCRQELAKEELAAHLNECNDFPIRCSYCDARLVRAQVVHHNRRCPKFPLRCPLCSRFMTRGNLEKHMLTECGAGKDKCRYCGVQLPSQSVVPHELECEAMRVACTFCFRYVVKSRLEAHMADCPKNPDRRLVALSRRSKTPSSVAPSTDGESRGVRERQRRLATGKTGWQQRLGRRLGAASENDGELLATPPASSAEPEEDKCECPYARYGCRQKVTRNNLADHLTREMADHLRLVSMYADQMEMENAALRRLVIKNSECSEPQ
ncbi:MCAK-like kinesin, putative [Trypanosoma cruzi marinkellei]|uniref:Kinesin-like protein n=1 Tax=Trypanosoma cruzi marinkellei TaxID=85056 RepID=K2NKY0_TRYCR|nr:MCAK-like kinesin, putative [Trypanosoma cruzi marinkellei]